MEGVTSNLERSPASLRSGGRCRTASLHRPSHHPNPLAAQDPISVLFNPHFNKGTAFSVAERKLLNLQGLLPSCIETIDLQVKRCLAQFHRFDQPMSRYIYLSSLRERNDTLFFRLLIENLRETMPYVYTPTVGQACQEFGLQFRQAEGMYISSNDRGYIRRLLDNWKPNVLDEVSVIVVTDGSRILGLGDLGACGMGIPIGKISLYVAAGGFHPASALPVVVDAGTNNETLLQDPFYLGERRRRLTNPEFYGLMEEFMLSVKDRWPRALVQFEDFSNDHCFELLRMWRNRMLCFNDDIQGTGAVIAAGFLNAVKASGLRPPNLRVLVLGSGSAGVGVASQIYSALMEVYEVSKPEAAAMFYLLDSKGLVTVHRGDILPDFKRSFARHDVKEQVPTFKDAMKLLRPNAIIGLSGMPNSFDEEILTWMGEWNDRPIIFPLSNPTSKSECTAEQAFKFTGGRCLFASGSPFDPVTVADKTYMPSQGNNLYTFPGIGFGSWLCGASQVSDGMLTAATLELASQTSPEELERGELYPDLGRVRNVSQKIATRIVRAAVEEGLARENFIPEDVETWVNGAMYYPEYLEWKPEEEVRTPTTCSDVQDLIQHSRS